MCDLTGCKGENTGANPILEGEGQVGFKSENTGANPLLEGGKSGEITQPVICPAP